jgi:hypothetical protein
VAGPAVTGAVYGAAGWVVVGWWWPLVAGVTAAVVAAIDVLTPRLGWWTTRAAAGLLTGAVLVGFDLSAGRGPGSYRPAETVTLLLAGLLLVANLVAVRAVFVTFPLRVATVASTAGMAVIRRSRRAGDKTA